MSPKCPIRPISPKCPIRPISPISPIRQIRQILPTYPTPQPSTINHQPSTNPKSHPPTKQSSVSRYATSRIFVISNLPPRTQMRPHHAPKQFPMIRNSQVQKLVNNDFRAELGRLSQQ